MKKFPKQLFLVLPLALAPLQADEATMPLVDLSRAETIKQIKPSSADVSVAPGTDPEKPGMEVTIQRGKEDYPGIEIHPPQGEVWDLSKYGHVTLTVTNIGKESKPVNLRVDNAYIEGKSPWNTESTYVKTGETKSITVIFGYAYGRKPNYKLDPSRVTRILVFTGKPKEALALRIESLTAAGPAGEAPPVDPSTIRVKPVDGYIIGADIPLNPDKQVQLKGETKVRSSENQGTLYLAFNGKDASAKISPLQGKWDLRDGYQVRVVFKNRGTSAVSPKIWVESDKGSTAGRQPVSPVLPGETGEVVVSFIPETPWTGVKGSVKTEWKGTRGTGTRFESNAAKKIAIEVDASANMSVIELLSARLEAPAVTPPSWVGQRPPVEGDWKMTFNEEFNGDSVDLTKWNIYTANYWDKRTHFSKENVIVADGKATLRYEKKRGHHNDDPDGKVTDYASGFLDTYGKWVQRYGYFEARMKLPTDPGLWPALWLMPDRGIEEGPQWKRADTGRGGMEFDIMEYLSGWGPHRYNVAFHWDGYQKEHKQTGTEEIYVAHDAEGYITTGLLWLPGYAAVYNNGRKVAEWESPRISDVPSDIMFTHVSGGWANVPLKNGPLPDDFVIDYVRCWQRADLASDVDGVQSTQPTPAAPVREEP